MTRPTLPRLLPGEEAAEAIQSGDWPEVELPTEATPPPDPGSDRKNRRSGSLREKSTTTREGE